MLYRARVDAGQVDSRGPDSHTLHCLQAAMLEQAELRGAFDLLVWDNSPTPLGIPLNIPFEYRHATRNDGVSGAYNGALEICMQRGYRWMLLLDDDTAVTAPYLTGMLQSQQMCDDDPGIAAIAPLLYEQEFHLSPHRVLPFRNQPVEPSPSRVLEEPCFAANSGVLIRTSSLAKIGGYSLDFWLDYSDIEMFHRLYAAGGKLYLASDLRLQHSMTMLDYDVRMTPGRYSNFLSAEQAFFDLYKTPLQNLVQILRLMARVWRQRRYRDKTFSRMTWEFLLQRIFTSKANRLQKWKARRLERIAHTAETAR